MRQFRFTPLSLLLSLSLLLAACAYVPTVPTTLVGEATPEVQAITSSSVSGCIVLRVAAPNDSYRNDPAQPWRTNVARYPLNVNVVESLLRMDEQFNLVPLLAESWENVDSSTWRFHLRRGVTFHDGSLLTAADVVATMELLTEGGPLWFGIDKGSAKAIDDYTVEITTLTPNYALPSYLSHPSYGILKAGSDPSEPVGTGPFKFVEYAKGDHIYVEKYEGYWGGTPSIDRIEFRFYPDPTARVLALQAREVDLVIDMPREAAALLVGDSRFRLVTSKVGAYQALSVNINGQEPYVLGKDPAVREAIGYAIDRQALLATAFGGLAEPSQTFIPAQVLGQHASQVIGYQYDLERAKAVLEEAGWVDTDGDGIREKNGRALRLELISGFPDAMANGLTPEVVQAQLRKAGIDITITTTPDNPSYVARLDAAAGDLFLETGSQNMATPCFLPHLLFYGKNEKPSNYQRAFAPALIGYQVFDEAIDRCYATPDLEESRLHAAEAMHILIDQARVVIPLVGVYRVWAASNRVGEFTAHPSNLQFRYDRLAVTELG
ncbi:MAG: ABC transporter substrate-binding protein [Anaerolineae bacterium]